MKLSASADKIPLRFLIRDFDQLTIGVGNVTAIEGSTQVDSLDKAKHMILDLDQLVFNAFEIYAIHAHGNFLGDI